jgi:hypothetical protein
MYGGAFDPDSIQAIRPSRRVRLPGLDTHWETEVGANLILADGTEIFTRQGLSVAAAIDEIQAAQDQACSTAAETLNWAALRDVTDDPSCKELPFDVKLDNHTDP